MKLRLITLTAISALSLGGAAFAQDRDVDDQERHGGRGHDSLERITERLNLTPEQKAKIQPIMDQAKPKMAAIHQEAMQKSKAVMDEAMGQIRPMLTPEQQKQLDDLRNDHRGGREGHKGRHDDGDDQSM
jgi:Spy/CpxP family protein refolding chaperone